MIRTYDVVSLVEVSSDARWRVTYSSSCRLFGYQLIYADGAPVEAAGNQTTEFIGRPSEFKVSRLFPESK